MTDWGTCPVVESVPDRLSGAWVFTDTRLPYPPSSRTWRTAPQLRISSNGSRVQKSGRSGLCCSMRPIP